MSDTDERIGGSQTVEELTSRLLIYQIFRKNKYTNCEYIMDTASPW